MKVVQRIQSLYAIGVFAALFLAFAPLLLILGQRVTWHRAALRCNYWWALLFFKLSFIKVVYHWNYRPKTHKQYIICANHFSFLDIPSMGLLPVPFKFVGKSSLARVPLFGYIYRKLHITVNRSSIKSRALSIKLAGKALKEGFSLVIFPEGGMISTDPPAMVSFKEGAFRLAVEYRVPILPVTLLTNFKMLPDNNSFLLRPGILEIIINPPLFPTNNSLQEIDRLKEETFGIIQSQLFDHHHKKVRVLD